MMRSSIDSSSVNSNSSREGILGEDPLKEGGMDMPVKRMTPTMKAKGNVQM